MARRARALPSGRALVLAAAALVIGGAAGVNSLANQWRVTQPAAALALRPGDALALAIRADQAITSQGAEALAPAAADARRALLAAPLTAMAVRVLAEQRMMNAPGDDAASQAAGHPLLLLAHDMTRRDLGTDLLLIQSAAASGDLDAVLGYYDEALSVSVTATPMLTRQLDAAMGDPAIAERLPRYAQRPWFGPFLSTAADEAADTPAVARLALATRAGRPEVEFAGLAPRILARLSAGHQWQAMRDFAGAALGGANAPVLTRFGFDAATADPRALPLAWYFPGNGGASATLASPGTIAIAVPPGPATLLGVRTTLLAPGGYVLRQTLSAGPGGGTTTPLNWELRCLSAPASLWHGQIGAGPASAAPITIPAGCTAQTWLLTAANDGGQPVAEQLSAVSLERR